TFLTEDFHLDDRVIGDPAEQALGTRSVIILPVLADHQVTGVILIGTVRPSAFSAENLSFMQAIAGQLSVAAVNSRLYANERRRAELMQLINLIGSELATVPDLSELLVRVVRRISEVLGSEAVYLFLREGPMMVIRAIVEDGNISLLEDGQRIPVTQGITGRSVRTSRSYITRDVRLDPDFTALNEAMQRMRSALTVPVKAADTVIGVLEMLSTEVGAFDETDRKAIETLSNQIAIAIENARLYNETQKRLLEQAIIYQIGQDLNTIVEVSQLAEAVVYHTTQALDTSSCFLLVHEPETGDMVIRARHQASTIAQPHALDNFPKSITLSDFPVMKRAVSLRRPLWLSVHEELDQGQEVDLMGAFNQQAALILPLIAGNQPLGLILAFDDRSDRRFSDSDLRLGQTIANQVAVTFERARLYDETEHQLQRETLLRRVAEAVNSWTEHDDMLEEFANEIMSALQVRRCHIFLWEDDSLFPALAMIGDEVDTQMKRLSLSDYPRLTRSLEQDKVLRVARPDESDEAERSRMHAFGCTSGLIVPLITKGRLLGLLEVYDDRPMRHFAQADVTLFRALANQLSVALDNARLYSEEHVRSLLLQKIQETSQEITSELQLSSLFEYTVKKVTPVFEVDAASIFMQDNDLGDFRIEASFGLSSEHGQAERVDYETFVGLYGSPPAPHLFQSQEQLPERQRGLVDAQGIKGAVAIPLLRGQEVFGGLDLYFRQSFDFNPHKLEMAQLLARQISIAIENANLFAMLEERARELATANRLKSEFLANISHELRTPLNSIIGFTETLLVGIYGPLSEKQVDRLETVSRNAEHLLALIDDLLDLSKIEAGRMNLYLEEVDIYREIVTVAETVEPQASEKSLSLLRHVNPELPKAWVDAQRLRQVLTNLLSNAIKFTHEGSVTIVGEAEPQEDRTFIHLQVVDTGIGISEEDQQFIFDEFRQVDGSATRQYEGTGLGLAITRKLIQLMNGEIWVESVIGQGSNFHILIPTHDDQAED
ncbi:MAG: GAF domain-containing protein, partial [Chloroflexi bacterium]|nr:GAF domain-containing protein [Chloroflexota bacterium]